MVAKNLSVAVLLDFYGEMLTDKQRDVIDLYYNQDLSLSEIAEHQGITRQGVRDSIKRGEVFLFELEDKLKLFDSYIETQKTIQAIKYVVERIEKENNTYHYSGYITDNIDQINSIIDNYVKKTS
ncbi:MAG: sigma factor-like helix-turn-helix DNA-binding protein [Oscillospiraceae bacterium]